MYERRSRGGVGHGGNRVSLRFWFGPSPTWATPPRRHSGRRIIAVGQRAATCWPATGLDAGSCRPPAWRASFHGTFVVCGLLAGVWLGAKAISASATRAVRGARRSHSGSRGLSGTSFAQETPTGRSRHGWDPSGDVRPACFATQSAGELERSDARHGPCRSLDGARHRACGGDLPPPCRSSLRPVRCPPVYAGTRSCR